MRASQGGPHFLQIVEMTILRYNDHVKSEKQQTHESQESAESLSVVDQILALQSDLRERMEGIADPQQVWKANTLEMHNEANNQKQRTFVRAILAGIALRKPYAELQAVVEKWQRSGVGDQKLATNIARLLEDATDEQGDYHSVSISAVLEKEIHKGHVPGVQPAGAGSQPIPRGRAA